MSDRSPERPTPPPFPRREAVAQVTVDGAERIPRPSASGEPLEVHRVAEAWDSLIEQIKTASKPLLATALQHSSPVTVNAKGELTIELDEPNDFYDRALADGRAEVANILRERFPSLERVIVRSGGKPDAPPPKRLTDEMVRAERLASLKKQDPVLRAAIETLDLDIAD